MKYNIVKTLSIFFFMTYLGCVKLDQVNPNAISEESFWKTEADLYQGVIATYDAMQLDGLYGGNLPVVFTGLSDDGTGESTNEFFSPFRFKTFDSNVYLNSVVWQHFYAMIGRAYQVIDRAPGISGPNVVTISAEARFLAAFAYYNLVSFFGDHIAYVDKIQQADDRPLRAENGEIYSLMEELLTAAIPDLPFASEYGEVDYGRATKGAAQALLAKAYMQQHKYMEAEPLLQEIILSGEYELLEDFAENFSEGNVVNPEALFVVNFLHDGPANETNRTFRHQGFSPAERRGSYGDVQPTKFVHQSFLLETDKEGNPDPRLDVTLFHENSTELYIGKPYSWWEKYFRNDDINTAYFKYSEQEFIEDDKVIEFDGGTDFIIIRYADILLLYAEALNENGKTFEAYQYVDMVRERSNMEKLSLTSPGLDKIAFLEQLKHERVVELSGELIRLFDLKRWGMYNSGNVVHDPNFSTFQDGRSELQPIPQQELDLNDNLIQNPGY
jgi:hypothetical protein